MVIQNQIDVAPLASMIQALAGARAGAASDPAQGKGSPALQESKKAGRWSKKVLTSLILVSGLLVAVGQLRHQTDDANRARLDRGEDRTQKLLDRCDDLVRTCGDLEAALKRAQEKRTEQDNQNAKEFAILQGHINSQEAAVKAAASLPTLLLVEPRTVYAADRTPEVAQVLKASTTPNEAAVSVIPHLNPNSFLSPDIVAVCSERVDASVRDSSGFVHGRQAASAIVLVILAPGTMSVPTAKSFREMDSAVFMSGLRELPDQWLIRIAQAEPTHSGAVVSALTQDDRTRREQVVNTALDAVQRPDVPAFAMLRFVGSASKGLDWSGPSLGRLTRLPKAGFPLEVVHDLIVQACASTSGAVPERSRALLGLADETILGDPEKFIALKNHFARLRGDLERDGSPVKARRSDLMKSLADAEKFAKEMESRGPWRRMESCAGGWCIPGYELPDGSSALVRVESTHRKARWWSTESGARPITFSPSEHRTLTFQVLLGAGGEPVAAVVFESAWYDERIPPLYWVK